MSELKLLDCVENGAGTCRNELLFEAMQRSCNGFKEKNRILAEELENLRAAKGIDEIERLRAGIERAEARAEAAENVINAAHAVLVRQVAEPHTSRGDTNAMVEAITILETVTLKGGA